MQDILKEEIIEHQLSKMNIMQQKAVKHTQGPLLILAGAGSGKTTVLINRIAYILTSKLSAPENILAITFTNKAARELVQRIDTLLGEQGKGVWASTFHRFCVKILRRHINLIGYNNSFSIFDTDDCLRIIKQIQKELSIDPNILPPRTVLNCISRAKDREISAREYTKYYGNDLRERQIEEIYCQYSKRLIDANALDFDDIILLTVQLFEQHPDVLKKYALQYKYVMVDEYQDTNPLQYKLICQLASGWGNLCVVGDEDQSIYKFRGANIENILSFEKNFKNSAIIRLEQNYRSTEKILKAASELISNNTGRHKKTLWTTQKGGELIVEHRLEDEYYESIFISNEILDNISKGAKYGDFAVLYRTNAQANMLERMLVKNGIPYQVVGGQRFYERAEIKDILAYLFLIHNTDDDVRLTRIINTPRRKIGQTTVALVAAIAEKEGCSMFKVAANANSYPELARCADGLLLFVQMINTLREDSELLPVSELIQKTALLSGYINMLRAQNSIEANDRIDNISELISTAITFEQQTDERFLVSFLEEISLMTDVDSLEEQSEKVLLMTLHSAKGLEFNYVFLAGLEEGLFPSFRSIENEEELEEERRLMYVGITRAKKRLYLTHTSHRTIYGSTKYNMPSRFISEIPDDLISPLYPKPGNQEAFELTASRIAASPSLSTEYKPMRKPQVPLVSTLGDSLEIGDKLSHRIFGEGVLLSKKKMANDYLLEINFDKTGVKKIMLNFARLEKVSD